MSRISFAAKSFVEYLIGTLIPELVESGRYMLASDFKIAVEFILRPSLKEVVIDRLGFTPLTRKEFVTYLRDTVVPQLKEGGYRETAADFETVIHFLG